MIRDIYNIDLEIPNSGIFIKGLENENLIISLDIVKFIKINGEKIKSFGGKLDTGELAKPLNPYIIYKTLEENHKNNFNGVKIIDKIEEENNIVYYFNFGLTLDTFIGQIEENIDEILLKKINKMKNFISFCCFSYEIVGDVTSILPSELKNLKNSYGYEGKNYKSIFKKEVYINYSCLERIVFSNCEFKSKVSLHAVDGSNKKIAFSNGVDFSNCVFEDEINFKFFVSGTPLPDGKYYNNEKDTIFKNCVFKKRVDFHNSKFVNSVYFNNSYFKDYVDFHECKFEKSACFYGVTFEKTPNFSACYFKEQKAVNLTNVNIDNLDFESVEKYIEDNYQDETYKNEIENIHNEEKEKINQINNKHKLRYAKNLKDSFRVIKDVLISQNNILEAQEWHKLELYAKEKETMIKATSINDNIDSKNTTAKFLKEELYNFTEWINFTLLFVYRNTSSHHTSFLKILNFTVVMIALYALLLFWLQNDSVVKSVFGFIVALFFATVIIIAFLSFIARKNIFKLCTFRIFLIVSMGYGVFLLLCFQNPESIIICCYILLASSISLMFFYGKYRRFFIVAFAYIIFFVVLIEKPQFINPFIGVFSSEKLHENKIEKIIQDLNSSSVINLAKISHKDFNLSWYYQDISFVELDAAKKLIVENKDNILDLKEQNLTIATEFLGKKYTEISKAIKQDEITSNVIKSTSVLYSIILLLCIFSLQKTARKNSIVPS
ncbi:pentapeptide repeat-containing protein [Campylobacter sp. RKI_CA19_01121]|uniref:pentapeptide repeat-containing protein n=1 Tax=Campylobacter sp. RKI_CA19_01121 TaxID=2911626 RepID=UPI0021E79271|nr:pentapeptide repeat-containing protein [Campylobacter sp. RKI_CA19_01121]MCV3336855.1 pentapeptide repeat-containing protein [Campylobacter sp. RKI_CA19_01121]